MKKRIGNFLKNKHNLPLIAGLASGLYPWAFYFSNNFDFVNSWEHFFFFLSTFILIPTAVYYLVYFLMRKKYHNSYTQYVLPALNTFVFFTLLMLALYATIRWKQALLIITATIGILIVSKFIKKIFPKLLVIQFLLLVTTAYSLAVITKNYLVYDDDWMMQPDSIQSAIFKKTPNIYVIQPDGYVNFSELSKGYYNYDNDEFENWLSNRGFTFYENFRSNYFSTLSSNSSLFTMKHHYYEIFDERNVIMNQNPVVDIFNKNGYKTHFLAEVPYLVVNRPRINFAYTSFDDISRPFISKGMEINQPILEMFPKVLENSAEKNFYFFEKLLPSHIPTFQNEKTTAEAGRIAYLENLEHANDWLQKLILQIETHDPDGLIIIVADHGGFVGFDFSLQSKIKTEDRDLLYSVFSSALAIKWPEEVIYNYDKELNTSVNLFRVLISYLSEDTSYLKNLQEDASYILIDENAPKGSYECIDENGNIVFKLKE